MRCISLTGEQYGQLAKWLDPLVEKACAVYGYDPKEISAAAANGLYGVFVALDTKPRALALVEIVNTKVSRYGNIFLVAGEGLTDWLPFVNTLLQECKARGCSYVEGTGRPGWERVLAPYGFTKVATTVRKQL